jgi:imidazolonepropionase
VRYALDPAQVGDDGDRRPGGDRGWRGGRARWRDPYAGPCDGAPDFAPQRRIDGEGRLATPGLIDCHTHLIYAGSRAGEFEARSAGATYEEIARAGGGIVSTMTATRQASEEDLVASALPRLDALIGEGVTTIEIKSGYGLTLETERRMLRAARHLGRVRPVRVVTTFLGAHALPPEFAGDADGYIELVTDVMIPALAGEGLIDAVDAFCEGIGFTPAQTGRVSPPPPAMACPSRSMPSNCPTCTARLWPPVTGRCQRIIWNISMRRCRGHG